MICLFCTKEIIPDKTHSKRKRKFCSRQCMWLLWKKEGRQNYRGKLVKQWKGGMSDGICKWCTKSFKFYTSNTKGYFCSKSCSGKFNQKNKLLEGNKNPMWKGDIVSYRVLHKWVRRHKIKPITCERCHQETSNLDLANKSQEYHRDINDFWYLCKTCHHIVDWQDDRRDNRGKWKSPKFAPSRIRLV